MGTSVSKLLFQPPKPASYNTPHPLIFSLRTDRGQDISAFYIDRSAPLTILFSHGNAEDLGLVLDWFREVSRYLHVNVMAYDYTGYGANDENPTEEDCYADIEAAFRFLTVEKEQLPRNIVLYGRSLGSGPSCHLAMKQSEIDRPVAGVILQSPLMSAYRVAFHFRFSLPGDKFCNIDKMRYIKSQVFIVHGTRDEIVPFWHGQELFLALQEKYRYRPFWVENAGHNNIELLCHNDDIFFPRLADFFRTIGSA